MSDSLSQAQLAADQEDWATVVTLLQRALSSQRDLKLSPTVTAAWLTLSMRILEAGDFQSQWDVAKLFPNFGRAAVAPLIQLLQDANAELESRWYAARILGDLNDAVAVQALVEQLQSTADEDLSEIAAEALTHLGAAGVTALTELLAAETTRLLALKALTQIHQPATVTPILSVVDDPDPAIRAIAVDALSSLDDARIGPVLMRAIKDPVAQVRKAAIAGLGGQPDWVQTPEGLSALANCLWDLNLEVCQQAALALGKVGQEAAVPWLQRALMGQNSPPDLQHSLILALSWVGSDTALQTLQKGLPPHPTPLAPAAMQAIVARLGRWDEPQHHPRVVQSLVDAMHVTSDPVLRRTIATALGELKHPNGIAPLIQLLTDPDPTVQLHAIAALQQIDPVAAYTQLTKLQSHQDLPETLRIGVMTALREWKVQLPR